MLLVSLWNDCNLAKAELKKNEVKIVPLAPDFFNPDSN